MARATKAKLMEPDEISVLLIEDSSGDAKAISKALHHDETLYSFKINRVSSLTEGKDFLNKHHVDTVLLDLGLPDAVALTSLNVLHSSFPELPIVIISGYYSPDRIHEALRHGAQEFLIKGECSGAAIRQSIYQAIARKKVELSYQRGDRL